VSSHNSTTERSYLSPGRFEDRKFEGRREDYYDGLATIESLGYDFDDFVHHFPCFVGHMTLSRFLALYECYKETLGVPGHIADVGVFKGASLLWWAKLVHIFEGEALTQVHGFDWFKGMHGGDETPSVQVGSYAESPERLSQLIEAQGLDNVVHVHDLDITTELEGFLDEHAHLQFKLVFCDAGTYDVTSAALTALWPRVTKGGIVILDQFNHEFSPGESRAVRELLPDENLRTFPWAWMPTAYVVR